MSYVKKPNDGKRCMCETRNNNIWKPNDDTCVCLSTLVNGTAWYLSIFKLLCEWKQRDENYERRNGERICDTDPHFLMKFDELFLLTSLSKLSLQYDSVTF